MKEEFKILNIPEIDLALKQGQKSINAGDAFNVILKGLGKSESDELLNLFKKKSAWSKDFHLLEINFQKLDPITQKYWVGATFIYLGGMEKLSQQLEVPSKPTDPSVKILFDIPIQHQQLFNGTKLDKPQVSLIEVNHENSAFMNYWRLHKPWIISFSILGLILASMAMKLGYKWWEKKIFFKNRKKYIKKILESNQTRKELEKIYQYKNFIKESVAIDKWESFVKIMDDLQYAPSWSDTDLKQARQIFLNLKESYRD